MTEKLHEMIAGANSNNLFMQCDIPDQNAFRQLPKGFTVRCCMRDELIIWKTMWAQGEYMDFVNYYYDKIKTTNANQALLEAALLNELAEF